MLHQPFRSRAIRVFRPLGVCTLLAVSASCTDVTAPEARDDPRFVAEFSGLVEATVEGAVATSGAAGETWTVTLATSSGATRVRFWTKDGTGPLGPGDYPLIDSTSVNGGEAPGDYVMARVELPPHSFPDYAEFDFLVGTLSITSSSGAGTEASFDLATSVLGQPTRILVVRGEFGVPLPHESASDVGRLEALRVRDVGQGVGAEHQEVGPPSRFEHAHVG